MDFFDKIINMLGGVSVVITGVVAYVGKLYFERYKATQEARNKELQANIDATNAGLKSKLENSVYVTKNQFDKEFSAYSNIWGAMFELKESVVNLRPPLDYIDKQETLEERKLRRLQKFKEAFNLLVTHVESNRPFLPVGIYTFIREFQRCCRKESIEYEHACLNEDGMRYWKDAEVNINEVLKNMDNVCEVIRERLHKLSVIE
ncbi:hypothetical protein [Enterobacter ludwigii]|uniref:hypothetical protein n=1 Tax=Enterobacter ludwigii TaxID=299767 RepID=UPI0023AAB186|nr:hypothetical protein [Enterobacter ludwigii]